MFLETPPGWDQFIEQLFEDINPLIQQEEDFSFLQIKEKFGSLRIYHTGAENPAIDDFIDKYEHLSQYVCSNCGKPAHYITSGYILPYCIDCISEKNKKNSKQINFNSKLVLTCFNKDDTKEKKEIECIDIWDRYINRLKIKGEQNETN